MDQFYNNSQNDFLWKLLADPANDAHLYNYDLQRLVNDYPQSGILQALLVHSSENKNLRQASAYFNARALYKLINAPSTLTGVPDERITIQSDLGSNGHYKPSEIPTANETIATHHEELPAAPAEEALPAHDTAEALPEQTTAAENLAEPELPPPVPEEENAVDKALPETQPLAETEPGINEPVIKSGHVGEAVEQLEETFAEIAPAEPEHQVEETQEPTQETASLHDYTPAVPEQEHWEPGPVINTVVDEPPPFENKEQEEPPVKDEPVRMAETIVATEETHPEKSIPDDEVFDEIVGIDQIDLKQEPYHPPAYEQQVKSSEGADYFTFDRAYGEHKEPEPVVVPEPEKVATGADTDQQDVSKYHDEKMPYTFMWWLDKTRKEHSHTYQPYIKPETPPVITKAKSVDELQQQYFENIFHITSVEELDKHTPPSPVPYAMKRKEQVIIDRFIKEEPQIKPQSSEKIDNENKAKKSSEDRDELVTETLASIYSDQMLYHKAIASYKKLMLKFPEKSRYFAEKIEQLEKKTN